MSRNPGVRAVVLGLLAVTILVASGITPGEAHDSSYEHVWRRHYRPLARQTFFTRTQASNQFVDVGEQASDADLLDGQDSTAFAGTVHEHGGADITSGTVAEARIAAAIARVADVFTIVLAADGSGSGLDADLLDGQSAAAFAGAGHGHALGTDDRRRTAPWFKEAADSVASATTSERVVFVAPDAVTITDVIVLPAAALTANDANYATITISRRDAGGGGRVTVGSETTQTSGSGGSGNWTAFAAVSLGSLSNVSLADGQSITIEVAKSGLGVALPVLVVQVEYTVD